MGERSSAYSGGQVATKKAAKSQTVLVIRLVFFAFLFVAAVILLFDRRARGEAEAAAATALKLVEPDESGSKATGTPTIEEVHQLLGLQPESVSTEGEWTVEVYTWKSPTRAYRLYLGYKGASPRLLKVSLNQPLDLNADE